MRRVTAILVLWLVGLFAANAQPWPSKPVRILVPYPPGGSGDLVGRAIAQKMTEGLGQPVIVDFQGGANGSIGAGAVARSAPDGYTLLLTTYDQFAIMPALGWKLPYDPVKDFDPVSHVAFVEIVLVAHPSLGASSVQELVRIARSRPGEINYASTGPGSYHHLSIEVLKRMGDFNVTHVPYKGAAPALLDLVSGRVQIMQVSVAAVSPYLKAGRLRALGVGATRRLPTLPDVPTVAEQGFPEYEATNYWCLFAPAGTSREILQQLQAEVARATAHSDIKERFRTVGLEPVSSSSAELAARIKVVRERWELLIRDLNLKLE